MMTQDRDMVVLIAGGVIALTALLLPFSLLGRMAVGVVIVFAAMLLAVLRIGPDRVTVEEYLSGGSASPDRQSSLVFIRVPSVLLNKRSRQQKRMTWRSISVQNSLNLRYSRLFLRFR